MAVGLVFLSCAPSRWHLHPCVGVPCSVIPCTARWHWAHPYFILLAIPACYYCLYKHYSCVQGSATWSIEKLLVQLNKLQQTPGRHSQSLTLGRVDTLVWPESSTYLLVLFPLSISYHFLIFILNTAEHKVDVYRELFIRLSRLLSWSPSYWRIVGFAKRTLLSCPGSGFVFPSTEFKLAF